jgi:hypothetical protein
LNVLQWAHDHHCPWNTSNVLFEARVGQHDTVLEWIKIKYPTAK